ncbi:MAG: hypothetical protein ACTS3R_00400, partial [Inquilinaceae bacterium]
QPDMDADDLPGLFLGRDLNGLQDSTALGLISPIPDFLNAYDAYAVGRPEDALAILTIGAIGSRVGKAGKLIADGAKSVARGGRTLFETLGLVAKRTSSPSIVDRPLTAADLGIQGKITDLQGTFRVTDGQATVRVDMIEGEINNPLGIVNNLMETARQHGATNLRLEGTIANPRLEAVLKSRYGATTEGANEIIDIPLGR